MAELPKISVVTVCLNAARTLERTLESVHGQGYDAYEHVVIDGGSTDGTSAILKRWRDRLGPVVSEPDRGISHAFNKGIARATGDVVGIVSADDYLPPGTLRAVASGFAPQVDVLYGNCLVWSPGDPHTWVVRPDSDFRAVFRRQPVKHASTWVSRRAYERHGMYDEQYRCAMDYELVLRFYLHGARFRYSDTVLGAFQLGGLNNRHYLKTLAEVRDASIRWGYARPTAYAFWLPKVAKVAARTFLERTAGRDLLTLYRYLSPRFRRSTTIRMPDR